MSQHAPTGVRLQQLTGIGKLVVEVLHFVREEADLAGDAIRGQVAPVDEAVQVPDRQAEPLGCPDRGDPSVLGVHGPPPMLSGFRRRR